MNAQKPYEQIRFIHDVIKDRKDKNQATFFSVKLETNGRHTPLVDKETGDTFYETIIQYLTRYDVNGLLIELYHGKAHNIKEPFQTFLIPIKRSVEISLGYVDKDKKDDIQITPAESVISTEKHYSTIMDKERQLLFLEFDLKKLQHENEELKRKNKKRKQYIEELEAELGKTEKKQKQSLGNVALGHVASNAFENLAKSDFGIGLLKHVFGVKEETINGLLGTTDTTPKQPETKSTASIITNTTSEKTNDTKPLSEEEKIRQAILKELGLFFQSQEDGILRLYFELVKAIGKDKEKLQQVYIAVQYSKAKDKAEKEKEKQETKKETPPVQTTESNEQEEEDTGEEDPDENDSS